MLTKDNTGSIKELQIIELLTEVNDLKKENAELVHDCYQMNLKRERLRKERDELRKAAEKLVAELEMHDCLKGSRYFDGEDRIVKDCPECDVINEYRAKFPKDEK